PHHAGQLGLGDVAQPGAIRPRGLGRDLVPTVDALPGLELERDPAARLVAGDAVADRAVAAGRAHRDRAVEHHRPPPRGGPQQVVGPADPVEQRADLLDGRGDDPLVDVAHHRPHLRTPPYGFPYGTVRWLRGGSG